MGIKLIRFFSEGDVMVQKTGILVALDVPTIGEANGLRKQLAGHVDGFKVGKQLITATGAPAIRDSIGREVFWDNKEYDIPNTVKAAATEIAMHGFWMFNVMCEGGSEMMTRARLALREHERKHGWRPLMTGVTILTSHNESSLEEVGMDARMSIREKVILLARLAYRCNLDGVVAPPNQIEAIRNAVQDDQFLIVTPGIRRSDAPADDQKQTASAAEAIRMGASYIVVGRPIINDPNPVEAADRMAEEIYAVKA